MQSFPLPKDPDEVLDYQFDWSDVLEDGETIIASNVFVAEGSVVIDSQSLAGGLVTFWLSGGEIGERVVITNRITTNGGRTYDYSGRLRIRTK